MQKIIVEFVKMWLASMVSIGILGEFANKGQHLGTEFASLTIITMPIGLFLGNGVIKVWNWIATP